MNLPLKLFRATVANTDIERLNVVNTFLKKMFVTMLVKFEQNYMVQNTQSFELFETKKQNKAKQNKTKQNKAKQNQKQKRKDNKTKIGSLKAF